MAMVMTKSIRVVSSIAVVCLLSGPLFTFAQTESPKIYFNVTVEQPTNGSITINPPIPADGKVAAGTVLTASVSPAAGYALDSGYYTIPGPWSPAYFELFTPEFKVLVDQNRTIGASLIEKKALDG